ncbi:hypothetical protein B1690_07235 [Geobacillus sp. 46C-IIa]|uniref:hypothetical protein n=1 Tax=Geobacillus sp. 46C-IIa TaxID=1963025 RepID=UPI0009BDB0BF|nr:hypothetical protein [Geobacillus sp. 46C-IIa]OQP06668.1 hypothetical protein B1690_07235 [Geobacillus sp. 46C-IIa]QNU27999.1 hypothetical protein IC803_17755 [Geobacillus sp. 46C-IIa]
MKRIWLLGVALLLSACSLAPDHPSYRQQSEDKNGTRLMTDERPKIDADRDLYNNFDDPEKTRQNPNFISLTEGSENQRADQRKAAQLIERHTDYSADSIWFHGGNMYVTVDVPETLSAEERQREARRIDKLLTKAIPTYEIIVRVN